MIIKRFFISEIEIFSIEAQTQSPLNNIVNHHFSTVYISLISSMMFKK